MKPIHKWQYLLSWERDYTVIAPFTRILIIGCIRFVAFPEQGEAVQKKHYKGFILRIAFNLPFIITFN